MKMFWSEETQKELFVFYAKCMYWTHSPISITWWWQHYALGKLKFFINRDRKRHPQRLSAFQLFNKILFHPCFSSPFIWTESILSTDNFLTSRLVSSVTETPRSEVFCRPLPADSSLHHELYHHFSSFPECRQRELLPTLQLKTRSDKSATDWTDPIDINCPGTQVKNLLSCLMRGEDVMHLPASTKKTFHIHIFLYLLTNI